MGEVRDFENWIRRRGMLHSEDQVCSTVLAVFVLIVSRLHSMRRFCTILGHVLGGVQRYSRSSIQYVNLLPMVSVPDLHAYSRDIDGGYMPGMLSLCWTREGR